MYAASYLDLLSGQEAIGRQGNEQHEERQDHAGGTPASIASAAERGVDQRSENGGRIAGTAVGQSLHNIEDLEPADDADDDGVVECGHDERQRHRAKLLPAAGTVELCGFIVSRVDRLKPRKQDDHRIARPFPDLHKGAGEDGDFRIGQPVLRQRTQPDCGQRAVDEPGRVHHGAEHQPDGDVVQHGRQEENRPHIVYAAEAVVYQQRQRQPEADLSERRDNGKKQGVFDRDAEIGVAQDSCVVFQPRKGKGGNFERFHVEKGQKKAGCRWKHVQNTVNDQRGQHK